MWNPALAASHQVWNPPISCSLASLQVFSTVRSIIAELIRQLQASALREKREIKKCLPSSTGGHQFSSFEFKFAVKGLTNTRCVP